MLSSPTFRQVLQQCRRWRSIQTNDRRVLSSLPIRTFVSSPPPMMTMTTFDHMKTAVQCFSSVTPQLLLDHWKYEVQQERLQHDPQQEKAAKKLQKLQIALDGYDNHPLIEHYEKRAEIRRKREEDEKKRQSPTEENDVDNGIESPSTFDCKVEADPEPPRLRVPRGLYLYGSVGTGKSMLMDRFFDIVPVQKKRRCHFHAFMGEVHERIHKLKQEDLARFGRNFHVDTDEYRNPIHRVGRQIAGETSLLCFDEFQCTDVCDALILSQLFSVLFTLGTVVVATSNRPPKDLYEGGVNRYYFMPFIDLLQKHCISHDMASVTDYRRIASTKFFSYFFTTGGGTTNVSPEQIDSLVNELRGDIKPSPIDLQLGQTRSLHLADADERGRLVRVPFDVLCDNELGAMDYRRLAYQFQIVVIEDVPTLNMSKHDLARRFITLVDELYEGRCALVCITRDAEATDPGLLFPKLIDNRNADDSVTEQMLGIDQAMKGSHPVGALASVKELDFAFERAASRITQMTSKAWWDLVLRPI